VVRVHYNGNLEGEREQQNVEDLGEGEDREESKIMKTKDGNDCRANGWFVCCAYIKI
jgi:hypothetical protein